MANVARIPSEQPKMTLEEAVQVYFVGAIRFGQIIIRYEDGRPTHVERREVVRLTKEPAAS